MSENRLYPIFLKTEQLHILIVGGGHVAEEKLRFLFKSSPDARVTLLAPQFLPKTLNLAEQRKAKIINCAYDKAYLEGNHLVIAATNNSDVNQIIYNECRHRNLLVNVADNPPLCDFYMGGIVTKGNIKLAISTNGKSPTTAKRLRQFFEDVLPDDIDKMVQNLHSYRKTIKGNFEQKVRKMNKITLKLIEKV